MSFNALYILITLSEFKEVDKFFASDENICCNIASFLGNNKNDDIFLFYGILLIRNIIMDKNVCEIFNKYKITNFYEEIYEKKLLNNKFMSFLCNSICFIINFELKKEKAQINISNLLPCIKIIATQLRPNYPVNLLYRYINNLYNLTSTNKSEIYYEMINSKVHKDFMNIYPEIYEKSKSLKKKYEEMISSKEGNSEKEINKCKEEREFSYSSCLIILKILGKIMYSEDNILTQTLLNADIASFLKDKILSNDLRVIKNASFCLANICGGTYGHIGYLIENNCLYELTKISKNIYDAIEFSKEKNDYYSQLKDTLREITFVFALAIGNLLFEKTVPLAECNDFTIVFILVKGLKYFCNFDSQELITFIVSALSKLISISHLFKVNICELMEKFGLKEYVENILLNKNWEIYNYVDSFYNAIFGAI